MSFGNRNRPFYDPKRKFGSQEYDEMVCDLYQNPRNDQKNFDDCLSTAKQLIDKVNAFFAVNEGSFLDYAKLEAFVQTDEFISKLHNIWPGLDKDSVKSHIGFVKSTDSSMCYFLIQIINDRDPNITENWGVFQYQFMEVYQSIISKCATLSSDMKINDVDKLFSMYMDIEGARFSIYDLVPDAFRNELVMDETQRLGAAQYKGEHEHGSLNIEEMTASELSEYIKKQCRDHLQVCHSIFSFLLLKMCMFLRVERSPNSSDREVIKRQDDIILRLDRMEKVISEISQKLDLMFSINNTNPSVLSSEERKFKKKGTEVDGYSSSTGTSRKPKSNSPYPD